MTEESNKKINFFKDLIKSIKDFDKYEDFAIQKTIDAFKYFLKLVLLFCAIISIVYTYKIVNNMNDIYMGIKDSIPNFSYEEGKLATENNEPIIIEDYAEKLGVIIIDTSEESEKVYNKYYESNIKKYGIGFIFSKDKLVMFNNQTKGALSYKYSDLLQSYNIYNFTKESAIAEIENISSISISVSIYFMIFIYLYILHFIGIMIDVLIICLFIYIMARFSRIRLKFEPSLNIAVHSITLPVLLNLLYIIINLLTGFEIKYFSLMYNTISYIYGIVAILMIKTDFINRQAELIKIAQEQIKIKEELKKQEEKKTEKQEDNNENKEDNNTSDKTKKEKKKEKNPKEPSGEPIGDASIVSDEKQ